MNKIRDFFSKLKPWLTPKAIGIALFSLIVLFGISYWFQSKTRESIKEHLFLVAVDNRWTSLDLHGYEGYMQGFVSELIEQIAKDEEIKIQVISVGASQLFDNLDKRHYDAVISPLSPNVTNQEKYEFSEPFYLTGPVLIVPLNSKSTTIAELHNVGIKSGYSATFMDSGQPLTSTIPFYNMNVALSELIAGKIDGLIMESIDAYAYVQGYYADKLKIVTPPLNKDGLRLITLRKFFGEHLVKIFDAGVKKAKEDKSYEKLLQRWELIDPETAYTH